MNARERKRLAKYRAGLILDSVLSEGWCPDDLACRYGEDEVARIAEEISTIAERLIEQSGRTA